MLTDDEITQAVAIGVLEIEPLHPASVQAASYDLRVGSEAFISGAQETIEVDRRGLVILEPGEFAVVTTRERVHCGPEVAGQLGLASTYARQGLTLLSGPQIDPGFDGVLVVRLTNLSPNRVTLPFEAPFLTAQFFRLARPSGHPYSGSRQGQTALQPKDLQDLSHADSPTIGGMVRTLAALAADVAGVNASVEKLSARMGTLTWVIPLLVTFGIAVIAVIVAIK